MNLRPAEIAMRQFSRTFLGADPAEVRQFLAEAAATLERVNGELAQAILDRTALQTTLKHTCAEVEVLRRQLDEAREKLATYQGQENLMARAWLNAQQVTEDLIRESQARAEQTIAEANAAAQETVQSARKASADLLKTTRAHAQQAVAAADRAAAARIAEVRFEAERMMAEARSAAAEAQRGARDQVEQFIARLEAFLASRGDLWKQLDALAKSHADSLEVVGRLHAEVEETILPAVRGLMRTLTEKDGDLPNGPAVPPIPAGSADAAPTQTSSPPPRPPMSGRVRGILQPSANGGKGIRVPAAQPPGEIIISPVHSYLEATKLVTAVSRVKGVRTARLRTYSKGRIIIDVMTDESPFAALDPHLIDGFPLDVVEATDRRLVLRIVNGDSCSRPEETHLPPNVDAT
jgi:cell division septum initiation protein DivIVA